MTNTQVINAYEKGLIAGQRFYKNNEPLQWPYAVGTEEYKAYESGVSVSVDYSSNVLF